MQATLSHYSPLTPRQREVLGGLKRLGRATSRDVAFALRIPLNKISGRFSELERRGFIVKAGRRGGFALYEAIQWPKEG